MMGHTPEFPVSLGTSERERKRKRERERGREREGERQKGRESERQRDRANEKERNRETDHACLAFNVSFPTARLKDIELTPPPWRQPTGKMVVSLLNSHTHATSKR